MISRPWNDSALLSRLCESNSCQWQRPVHNNQYRALEKERSWMPAPRREVGRPLCKTANNYETRMPSLCQRSAVRHAGNTAGSFNEGVKFAGECSETCVCVCVHFTDGNGLTPCFSVNIFQDPRGHCVGSRNSQEHTHTHTHIPKSCLSHSNCNLIGLMTEYGVRYSRCCRAARL